MKKLFPILFLGLALILAACQPSVAPSGNLPGTGGTQAPAATQAPALTQGPAATAAVTLPPVSTEAPGTAVTTSPVQSTEASPAATETTVSGTASTPSPLLLESAGAAELANALKAAGATVTPAEPLAESIFQVKPEAFTVNGEQVQVFEFTDLAERKAASDTISENGSIIGASQINWIGQPNFWARGRLIVLYIGDNQQLIDLLTQALGAPLTSKAAGGTSSGLNTAIGPQVQRWLAQELGVSIDSVQVNFQERVQWPDACLGAAQTGEMCAQVVTPGWRVLLTVNGQQYEVHTDESGSTIRLAPSPSSTATP